MTIVELLGIAFVMCICTRTMRAELIGHFQPCMTDIYLHIDARMADYIRTHPYLCSTKAAAGAVASRALGVVSLTACPCYDACGINRPFQSMHD